MINTSALVPTIGDLVSPFSPGASASGLLLFAFGRRREKRTEYRTKYYDNTDSVWNILTTPVDNGRQTCFDRLRFGDNRAAKGISVILTQPTSGAGACVKTFAGHTAVLDSYLDTSVVYGSNCAEGGVSVTFSGLKAGKYMLLVLGARGNGDCAGEVSYGVAGEGVTVSRASVPASSQTEESMRPSSRRTTRCGRRRTAGGKRAIRPITGR